MSNLRTEKQEQDKSIRHRTAYIINVGDETWMVQRPYRNAPYEIKARGAERYTALEITGERDRIDMGDGKYAPLDIMADEIANDLIHEQNLAPFGLFVSYSENPTEQELKKAELRRNEHYMKLVGEADADWMRFHNITMIQDVAKRAARRMGYERDWLYDIPDQDDCPACGEKIKPGVAICKSCHCVIDAAKFAKMKFAEA